MFSFFFFGGYEVVLKHFSTCYSAMLLNFQYDSYVSTGSNSTNWKIVWD